MAKKRILFFSIYDKDGVIDRYIEYWLASFRGCVQKMVVVVNGELGDKEKEKLLPFADDLIVRENRGFDAGAYKEAIKYLGKEAIKEYDELILCNDTCYGPFVPIKNIFETMEQVSCDFWGMHYTNRDRISYLCSYFLVFRKTIVAEDVLYEYFEKAIDENTTEISDVHVQFETGLFIELCSKYNYGVYTKWDNLNVTKSPDYAIKKYGFPVMKRKVFSEMPLYKDNAYNALKLIDKCGYDISMILDNVERVYELKIDKVDVLNAPFRKTEEKCLDDMMLDVEALKEFCRCDEKVYIYGCGIFAKKLYVFYHDAIDSIAGFVISDGQTKNDKLYGKRVFYLSETDMENSRYIIGMDLPHTKEVLPKLKMCAGLLKLWKMEGV